MDRWCSLASSSQLKWHLTHDALSCWLLLVTTLARKRLELCVSAESRSQYRQQQQEQQHLIRLLAKRMFEEAVAQPSHTLCMTHRASIFSFAAAILLKFGEHTSLVLCLALRMSGEPGGHFVHTFVREAGIQIMLMLRSVSWSNLSVLFRP
jgi:hypothetical protein